MDNTEREKSETAKRASFVKTTAAREEEILKFWQTEGIFEKSLDKDSPKGEFVFYEGPPTANGKPGIHHLEARAFKDVIPRYKTMQGYHVRRKGGWDTHGLPVELQVEKQLGLKSKKEVEEYGVEAFNKKCKESVWEYLDIWNKFTKRIGYWVDQEHPYVTYENSYIEAVWNVLAKVHDQKLLYKDYKVVPWCPRCGTALSSHELAQGYDEVKDLSVYVKFKIVGEANTYLLAWTTTPWTLPGNVALAVGENVDYVEIKLGEEILVLAKERLSVIEGEYEIIAEHKGKEMIGMRYEPLFGFLNDNFKEKNPEAFEKAYQVYAADFVNTEDGTGIVHTAVMYGQDDFELGTKVGLPKFHLVAPDGTFVKGTGFLEGRFVKEMDEKGKPTLAVDIIDDLKKRNLFFNQENIKHTYPFCWRCKTALIYYARDSWYIKMSSLREKLVKENEEINWVPAHIKEGRFGEWLREIKDWAISRERFWGTPLPVWQAGSEGEGEVVVINSVEDLKKKTKKSGNRYFTMRHGEAESNMGDTINSDPKNIFHLTQEGQNQVQIAAEDLRSKKIDLIITSPFARCQETSGIVHKALGLPTEIVVDDRLVEFKKGPELEGKTWSEYWKLFSSTRERFEKSPDGGESLLDLNKRVGGFLYDIEEKYKDKNILIVTHQGLVTAMRMVVEGADLKRAIEIKEDKTNSPVFAEISELDFVPLPHNENYELDLHKPYIDQVVLVDEKGQELKRVKEVMDVWFDSGAMPFAQDGLGLKDDLKYPADFISEAIDQTRGWFYTLHAIGILMGKGKAYKNVICLGHILDSEGKKMSKSLGNIIDPWLMIEKYGVDALRFWMYAVNQPGDSKNFDEKTVDEIVKKVFNPTENILSFYEMYKGENSEPHGESVNVLDRWIISLLNKLIKEGEKNMDSYRVFESARAVREFVNDFSTWYIRRSRERFKSEDVADREAALSTTRFVLLQLSKYMAPFTPFFAEHLYLKLKSTDMPESVHLCEWPQAGEVNKELLEEMELVRKTVSEALMARNMVNIKVRQPLGQLRAKSLKLKGKGEYLDLIKDEVNVKEIVFDEKIEGEVELDTTITPELQKEGNVREFVRAVQDLRKAADLSPHNKAALLVETDIIGEAFLKDVEAEIKKPTNISEIKFEKNDGAELKIESLKIVFKLKIIN